MRVLQVRHIHYYHYQGGMVLQRLQVGEHVLFESQKEVLQRRRYEADMRQPATSLQKSLELRQAPPLHKHCPWVCPQVAHGLVVQRQPA